MPESVLERIISASSKRGDCVLDPFIGSGTTATAAYKLGRNYAGLDISEDYVENCSKRLSQLQKENTYKLFYDSIETGEIQRLLGYIGIEAKDILESEKLLTILAGQLNIRTNNDKKYNANDIKNYLEGARR